MRNKPGRDRVKFRFVILPVVALALGACATHPPPALSLTAESAAANYETRSLQDAGLRGFLAENLGSVPAMWDADALNWVAFYFHPSLGLARAQWATTRAAQQSAAARPNPTISLTPGYNSTRTPGVSPWFPSVNFDFLLQKSGKRARQQDIARADAEAARLAVLAAAWQVRIELAAALTAVADATRREASLRSQAAGQREILALLDQRLASGFATAFEVSPARLTHFRMEAALADAVSQQAVARTRTAAALGLPLAALDGLTLPHSPPGAAIPAAALTAARRQSLQTRSDVLAALAKIQAAEAALALEAAKQQPDFHLGPGYQWDQGANKWSVALSFELPLFHRNEGPIAEATARRGEAVAQFNAVQARAVAEIETAATAQFTTATQREHARRVHAELEKQNALVQQRLKLGAADQVEQLSARLDVAVAAAAVADAESAVGVAAGQLEAALQIPFPHHTSLADAARAQPIRTP